MLTTAHEITSTVQGGAIPRFAIEVSGLVKTYDQIRVVDGLDLRVDTGQIFGLLGANGAGKTTAVECLQGLRRPDAGRLRVLGLDPIGDRDRLRLLVGSQLQDSALPDRLRVHEAIALFDQAAHPRREQVLEQWGLTTAARTMFGDLSGGQRQRLFIALALLNNPQLVFLDELTQGLDASARRDVWDVIRRIRELGTTVVLVSHFADEIETLCDRVAVIAHGRVVDTGTPLEITRRHAPHTTISFTQPDSFDAEALHRIPAVRLVERVADTITVTGNASMIAPVCAATLDDNGAGPMELRVSHPTLDDALVNLIGANQ